MSRADAKLGIENQSILFRMHAEGHSFGEILRYFEREGIVHPRQNALRKMVLAKCHQAEIEAYREEYYARIKDVPISRKRTRLEIRDKLIKALEKTFEKMVKGDGTIKASSFKKFMALIKRVDEMLTGAQDEMERRPGISIALLQNIGSKGITDEELLVEERNIIRRIRELQAEGISFSDRAIQDFKEGQGAKD